MICVQCGTEFEAKRADAKYCSSACRMAASRSVTQPQDVAAAVGQSIDSKPQVSGDKKPYDREAALAKFREMGLEAVEWLTTGIPEFDELTKIPRGRVTQIQGPYAVGKTTLCLNMLKGLSDDSGVRSVLYIDSEASLNPQLMADLELDPDKITLYNRSAFIEDIYEVVIDAATSGKFDLIIFDSLAACSFRTEAANEAADANIGQKAKIVGKLMRIVPMELKRTKTALVIINQERETIGTYVAMKYTPGGMGVLYAASLIVRLSTTKSARFPLKPKDGKYQGHTVLAEIIKSKVNDPWRTKMFKLYYGGRHAEVKEQEAGQADMRVGAGSTTANAGAD